MFKSLIDIFKKEDLLQQSYDSCIKMLRTDFEMFEAVSKSLRNSDTGELSIDIYAKDAEINAFEREVRRKVLAHLMTSPARDIVFGLILVSIVIDIERIGDFMKNIIELAEYHPRKLSGGPFEEFLVEIEIRVNKRFNLLIKSFEESDTEMARAIMLEHRDCTKSCDKILHRILKGELNELPSSDAVSIALYIRYMKRISSHITNVASGIVNPFDRIGFKE